MVDAMIRAIMKIDKPTMKSIDNCPESFVIYTIRTFGRSFHMGITNEITQIVKNHVKDLKPAIKMPLDKKMADLKKKFRWTTSLKSCSPFFPFLL